MRIAKSTQPEKKGLDPPKCVVLRYLPRVRVSLVGIGQRDSATIWRGRVDPRVARLIGVMVGLGVAHVSGTSTAQYPPFPAYDQPYTCADAPPKLGLPIAPPSGDGWFEANGQLWSPEGEYWYGHGIKLDDWHLFKSEPLIDGYLVWADSTADLIIGLRVKSDRCREGNCAVFVAIDENRSATLDHPLSVFGEEDRIFVVSWNEVFPESPRIKVVPQWQGPDPTRVTEPHLQWPIEAAVGLHESDQGGESYHLEIKIGLPRTSAGASRGAPIGLAIGVVTVPPEEKSRIPPSYYVWPNVPADKNCGQWIARPRFPYTYMTVEPVTQFPEPSTGFLTYNVGLMPYMANGGDGSPHDFATYFAEQDVHVACFQEVWEHGQREQIAALAYELTGKTAQAIGLGSACAEDKIEDGGCSKWDYLLETVSSKALHVQDLGLLMLSKTGMIASDIITFGDDRAGCKGADCLEEKGALWARVGTAQAAVDPCPGDARNCPDRIIVPERSVDVFCTHLQASCDQLAHPRAFWDGVAEVFELAGISIATLLGADYNLSKILCLDPNDYKIVQANLVMTINTILPGGKVCQRIQI